MVQFVEAVSDILWIAIRGRFETKVNDLFVRVHLEQKFYRLSQVDTFSDLLQESESFVDQLLSLRKVTS